MTLKDTKEPQGYASASQDAKGDGKASDANLDRVVAVDIERLCRPEHDDRDEIGTGNKRDDKGENQDARFLLQSRWEDGVLSPINFPKNKANEDEESNDERNEDVD
jgi:hypothetical protein